MAAKPEGTVSLKIFVDKKSQRVVLAESDKHFVDILVSFLTLPLGTIVRLLGKEMTDPAQIGCMNNLYDSVEKLSTEDLLTNTCKSMLLRPCNIWASSLRKLKVNVDNSEPIKYFICSHLWCNQRRRGALLSNYINARCSCGRLMTTEVEKDIELNKDGNGEVFITGAHKFLITNDLQVMHSGPTSSIKVLSNVGISDVRQLDERTLTVGLEDIGNLLKQSLISKSPLTDVFLPNQGSNSSSVMHGQHYHFSLQTSETVTSQEKISLKLLKRKSDNRVFFAEAREDFVDFLFSFFTVPLGRVVGLLGGKFELGCIEKLYTSVKDLNSEWFVEIQKMVGLWMLSPGTKDLLLNSRVAPRVSCSKQLLNIEEDVHVEHYCYSKAGLDKPSYVLSTSDVHPLRFEVGMSMSPLTLTDPKTQTGGYVLGPAMYMVSDDLIVTPMSSYSLSCLNTLEFPTQDFEECLITIGTKEAVHLLKAALSSTSALTNGLTVLAKKPKQEK